MRWWLPQGAPRPDHLPPGGIACACGPDGGAGLVVGCGPYHPGEPGWLQLDSGLQFHPGDHATERLLRLTPIAGPAVLGALAGQAWMVPQLLRPGPGGLECALPRTLTAAGFEPPAAYAELMRRLRLAVTAPAELGEAQLALLAIEILSCNYHLSDAEVIAAGWLTDQLASAVLIAAAGLADQAAEEGD